MLPPSCFRKPVLRITPAPAQETFAFTVAEQPFRILCSLLTERFLRCDVYLSFHRGGRHEEVWLHHCSARRNCHRCPVDCKRRNSDHQEAWLSPSRRFSRSPIRSACRISWPRSRLAPRSWSSQQGGDHQEAASRLLRTDTGMAPGGAILLFQSHAGAKPGFTHRRSLGSAAIALRSASSSLNFSASRFAFWLSGREALGIAATPS